MRRLLFLALLVLVGWLVDADFLWPLLAVAAALVLLTEAQALLDRRR